MIVITFERFRPPARYDLIPWSEARIEESDAEDGTYTQIDIAVLSPVDAGSVRPGRPLVHDRAGNGRGAVVSGRLRRR